MIWVQRQLLLASRSRGAWEITRDILQELPELSSVEAGILHLFLQHTSASLTINENADPDVPEDLERICDAVFPESFPFQHTCEGRDDMPAHVKSSVFGASLSIPVGKGRLLLGTWQGVFLFEHRARSQRRKVVLTLFGQESESR